MKRMLTVLAVAISAAVSTALAGDVTWMWDDSGRVRPEDPAIFTEACMTTFDSRLFAIGYANPVADGLLRFDTRLFSLDESEGIDFDSTKLGLFIIVQ